MFMVCFAVQRFNNRDEHVGTRYYPVDGLPGYETLGLARRMAKKLEVADQDQAGPDVTLDDGYFVIDSNRGPIHLFPGEYGWREADEFDEIPF